jgi:hypothetical protein
MGRLAKSSQREANMDDVTETTEQPSSVTERRTRLELRALFPAACAALQPFFDPTTHWAGQSHEHLALRTLKEQFPELSAQDAFLVVATAKRLFSTASFAPTSREV